MAIKWNSPMGPLLCYTVAKTLDYHLARYPTTSKGYQYWYVLMGSACTMPKAAQTSEHAAKESSVCVVTVLSYSFGELGNSGGDV